jgi:RNA polymerase sigma factor (sigma-70 family)
MTIIKWKTDFFIKYFLHSFVFYHIMEAVLKKEMGRVVESERHRLLAFIRSKVHRLEDAEDIFQDVLVSTLERISVTDPIENVAAWLYTTARNRIVDWYRKKKPVTRSFQEKDDALSFRELIDESGLNPEEVFFKDLLADEIFRAVEALPAGQRDVFVWQAVEGRSFREIAEMTGESVNTLLSRKRYAVQFLRKRLSQMKELMDGYI